MAPLEASAVELREVREDDIPIFFEHQCDPQALAMAAFSARGKDEFIAHWTKLLGDPGVAKMTILHLGEVAGRSTTHSASGRT